MFVYKLLADLVVLLHVAYVGFVVLGFVLILVGLVLRWNWVRNAWFRLLHLAMIAVVCLEAVLGIVCPLTTLEKFLRKKGGQAGYSGDFIGHWLHELIFFEAPSWVFTLVYFLFGLLVAGLFFFAPPRFARR